MKLENKIKSIGKIVNTSKLTPLDTNSAATIEEFWDKVVEPLLPDYDVMKKWHDLLINYISLPNTVFMIRKGNEESKKYIETVKADALRRGFLTKTDLDYWFFYNDNDFATYMLAMVLDGDVIDTLTAHELLQYFKTHNAIIRFNQSGSKGIEKARAYFKIDGTQPRISKNGYTVAHIFDVNKHYYDSELGFHNVGGEDALKSSLINIDKGMYSDYKLQGTTSSRKIYYRDNYHPGEYARKFLEAHTLRFLHPLNFFCAPKDNMNGYIYCEYTDNINNRIFKRISGYEHLLYYAHHKFKEKYKDIYDDYLKRIMLPTNTFDFFEKGSSCDYFASEVINIKYGNPLYTNEKTKVKTPANNTQKAISNKNNKIEELSAFFDYLIKNGKKPTTADGYRKAIKRVIVRNSLSGIEELNRRIDEMIELYDGNDQASHNTHIAALKRYADYLYFKNSYQVTLDNDDGTKEVVWTIQFADDKIEDILLEVQPNSEIDQFLKYGDGIVDSEDLSVQDEMEEAK